MKSRSIINVALAFAPFALSAMTGCRAGETMTNEEAGEAVQELSAESEAQAVAAGTIEITTSFTIGQAVDKAADEIKAFVESQLPCAAITREAGTLTIEYGKNPGDCTFHGQTWSGKHIVSVSKDEEGEIIVEHTWEEMQNQRFSVSGSATVTWNLKDPSRHVVHELTWTRLSDGKTGTGSGDRVQEPLDGDLATGIVIDGSRSWKGAKGEWDLQIDGVEARWVDPIPQAGSYELTNPAGKVATLSFDRVDEDSIQATLATGRKEYVFIVHKDGSIESEKGQ
jgi:hypothetical protein